MMKDRLAKRREEARREKEGIGRGRTPKRESGATFSPRPSRAEHRPREAERDEGPTSPRKQMRAPPRSMRKESCRRASANTDRGPRERYPAEACSRTTLTRMSTPIRGSSDDESSETRQKKWRGPAAFLEVVARARRGRRRRRLRRSPNKAERRKARNGTASTSALHRIQTWQPEAIPTTDADSPLRPAAHRRRHRPWL